tara:strand:- start:72 stop:275 length:204 start_codon:yes stop_codon:yes gene_type:complete
MVKSPCINICKIDKDSGLCIGCCRDGNEIFNWISFSQKQKKIVLSKISERRKINNKSQKVFFKMKPA